MAVVRIFTVDLTGARRQQVLQGPKTVLDPVAPLPCPYQPWPADGGGETHDVKLLLPGLTDYDEGHGAIRRTGRSQPRIAHPWHLLTRPPRPLAVLLQVVALDLPSIGQVEVYVLFPSTRKVPSWVVATWRMSFESLNQLSATTIGGGNSTPRWRNAAIRPSSMLWTQCSLSRHGAPGPGGSGRRMAKSTGTTNLPSPTTTTSNTPSMPARTRCSWPLHQVPTSPNRSPYFLNTESSPTQVHFQRLRVASLLLAACRHSGTNTSRPKRLNRLSQERLGSAPSRREGRFLSQPRTRHSSVLVRHPNSGGHLTPTIFPRSVCWLCKRPSISVTKVSGRPNSSRAWWRASAACWAWRRSRARRSAAVRRQRCLALACR